MIPKVKTWIVTIEGGKKIEVLAPTKLLAKLNYRHDYSELWRYPILKIGQKRKA